MLIGQFPGKRKYNYILLKQAFDEIIFTFIYFLSIFTIGLGLMCLYINFTLAGSILSFIGILLTTPGLLQFPLVEYCCYKNEYDNPRNIYKNEY